MANNIGITCKNCGAPVTTEICPYCGSITGYKAANDEILHSAIKNKSASLTFTTIGLPLIFAGMLTVFSIFIGIALFGAGLHAFQSLYVGFFFVLMAGGALFAYYIPISHIIRYMLASLFGKRVKGIVYGYKDGVIVVNGATVQDIIILIEDGENSKYVKYKSNRTIQKLGINDEIELKNFKNIYIEAKPKRKRIEWK